MSWGVVPYRRLNSARLGSARVGGLIRWAPTGGNIRSLAAWAHKLSGCKLGPIARGFGRMSGPSIEYLQWQRGLLESPRVVRGNCFRAYGSWKSTKCAVVRVVVASEGVGGSGEVNSKRAPSRLSARAWS